MDPLSPHRRANSAILSLVLLAAIVAAPMAIAQENESTLTGTVVSSTRNTLVVRDGGRSQLFVYERGSRRPATIPVGSQVRVTSTPGDEPGVRVATDVTITQAAGKEGAESAGAVPPDVRRLEREIERQVRRYQAGVRAGVALDPELVLVGVHAQVGPFFSPDVFLRPNVEFAWGEVTTLVALNFEGIYRLPISSRQGRWTSYVGLGPALTFLHQNFERKQGEARNIDFGNFTSDFGLNILGGVRYRSGLFTELKASVYSDPAPTLRLIIGYNF